MSEHDVDRAAHRLRAELAGASLSLDALARLLRPCAYALGILLHDATSDEEDDGAWAALREASGATRFIQRHAPHVQIAILRHASLKWHSCSLDDEESILAWLSPTVESASASQLALSARAIILTPDTWQGAASGAVHLFLDVLDRLSRSHLLLSAHRAIFGAKTKDVALLRSQWQVAVAEMVNTPSKVANFLGSNTSAMSVPDSLHRRKYMASLSKAFHSLLTETSAEESQDVSILLGSVLTRMNRTGYFSASETDSGFWPAVLPSICSQLPLEVASTAYCELWQASIEAVPAHDARIIIASLLATIAKELALARESDSLNGPPDSQIVRSSAHILQCVFGECAPGKASEVWASVIDALLYGRLRRLSGIACIIVCWAACSTDDVQQRTSALLALADQVIPVWSDPDLIAKGDEALHRNLTICLASICAAVDWQSPQIAKFSHSGLFLVAVQNHLSASRLSVRLRGMLIAEVISAMATPESPLRFGEELWTGQEPEKLEAREIRLLAQQRVEWLSVKPTRVPQISSPAIQPSVVISSVHQRRAEPENQEEVWREPRKPLVTVLASTDDDDDIPAYAMPQDHRLKLLDDDKGDDDPEPMTKKRPKAPVYVRDLAVGLRTTDNADIVHLALQTAPTLLRSKFGTGELEENAVDLAFALIGIQDNFDLRDFEEFRLEALAVLTGACPRKVGQCLVEQLFGTNYSLQQRFAMLSALSWAVSPSAAHPVLPQLPGPSDGAFGRKALPGRIQTMIGPIESSRREPQQRLTVSGGQTARIPSIARPSDIEAVALPFINRLWLYLGDIASAPQTVRGKSQYLGGAGSAIIFEPLLLRKILSTLAIMLIRCVISPRFSSFLGPESLELVLALKEPMEVDGELISAAFEVVMVVLQGAVQVGSIDELGRTHRETLAHLQDWSNALLADGQATGLFSARLAERVVAVSATLEEVLAHVRPVLAGLQTRL